MKITVSRGSISKVKMLITTIPNIYIFLIMILMSFRTFHTRRYFLGVLNVYLACIVPVQALKLLIIPSINCSHRRFLFKITFLKGSRRFWFT